MLGLESRAAASWTRSSMGGDPCVPASTPVLDFLLFLALMFFGVIVVQWMKESSTKMNDR